MSDSPRFTEVFNLSTGKYALYDADPATAVKLAYLQFEKGDFNTYDYDLDSVEVTYGEHTVSCGDYCAFLDKEERDGGLPASGDN
jgi:hypothetical protein